MRFSLESLGDLDVEVGTTVGELRAALVDLTGDPSWRTDPLGLGGRLLGEDHPAGIVPWVAGAALGRGPGEMDPVTLALAAPWYLATVAGPDAGAVAGPERGRVVVGRGEEGTAGRLASTDPAVSRTHLEVRRRRRFRVRDLGSVNGTTLTGRRRFGVPGAAIRVGRFGRRLRPGDRLEVGDTVLELRGPVESAARRFALAPVLVPLVLGVGMAVMARNPWFLAMGLTGPVLSRTRTAPTPDPEAGPEPEPAPLAPDAPAQAAAARAPQPPEPPRWVDLARDGLAVVGPDRDAVIRALVTGALAPDPAPGITLVTDDPHRWRWCRWLVDRVTAPDDLTARGGVVVVDGSPAALTRWWAERGPGRPATLLAVSTAEQVPAWCAWRLVLGPRGAVLQGPTSPGGDPVVTPRASARWAETQARLLAGRARRATWPDRVDAVRIGLPSAAAEVVAGWARGGRRGLATPIGIGADGRVIEVDLAADGPHALVAGTTGAGKSELLQTLVAGLTARYPPHELALVLIDFKGGAGFGACAALPHVAGQVTDLDPAAAARALEALRAELHRRERVVADHGATDLDSLRAAGGHLPRLLVVVDEFRALAEDLPRFLPALVRLAAQGRSLGIHLVLATQRPAGAVDAQMRANVALRLCLRVTDPADSVDVVGVPGAADLPPDRPGRLLLGSVPVQSAWLALPPERRPAVVRAPWPAPPATGPGPDPAQPARLVAEIREAARRAGSEVAPVWSPPLPAAVTVSELAERRELGEPPPGRLAIAIGDPAGAQGACLVTVAADRPLAVVGAPGSGRTTTLRTLAQVALTAGRAVHVVAPPDGQWSAWADRVDHPNLGTIVTTDDPRRLARLLTVLAAPGGPPALVLVDGPAGARAALDRMPRAAAIDLLDDLLHAGPHQGVGIVLAGTPTELGRSLALLPDRLVLPVAEAADDLLLGVARDHGGRASPGRAVALLGADRAGLRCQVALPDPAWPGPAEPGPPEPGHLMARPAPRAVRLLPLPRHVPAGPARAHPGGHVDLGVGGDDAGPVTIRAEPGLLITGPPGSGRSTALAVVAAGLRANGLRVVTEIPPSAGPDDAVLLDDPALDPADEDRLAAWVRGRSTGGPAPLVVVTAHTDRAAGAFRGPLAELRRTAPVLVLDPAAPGSAEAAGARLDTVVDPAGPGHPGRGALLTRAGAIPVQVRDVSRREGG